MPCDTIQTSSVNLEMKADNKTYLMAALKSLNYNVAERNGVVQFSAYGVNGTFVNGKLTLNGRQEIVNRFDVNPLKRAYSVQVVKSQAKKYGWEIKQPKQEELKFTVMKKGF